VELFDLYPTVVELCGLPRPAHLEGRSFAAQLAQPDAKSDRPAFTTTIHQGVIGRSVRTDRWRYTEWGDGVAAELYDHAADPDEYRNLATDPKRATDVAAMKALLARNPRLAGPVPGDAQTERKGKRK
jgi:iduronate 2-sulfatase